MWHPAVSLSIHHPVITLLCLSLSHIITETRHVFLKTRTETKNETKKKKKSKGYNVAVMLQRCTVAGPRCGALSSLMSPPSIILAPTSYCTTYIRRRFRRFSIRITGEGLINLPSAQYLACSDSP